MLYLLVALCLLGLVRGEEMELDAKREPEVKDDVAPMHPDGRREMQPQWWSWGKNKWDWHDDDDRKSWSWGWDGHRWSWGWWGNKWEDNKKDNRPKHWSWKNGKWDWGW